MHTSRNVPVRAVLLAIAAGAFVTVTQTGCHSATETSVSERPDFTGLWQMAASEEVVLPEADEANLTDETKARLKAFRENFDPEVDDQIKFCVPNGMPWMMLSRARSYLTDIHQTDRRITIVQEFMDGHRVIHMNQDGPPETFTGSSTGYSVGRWEGAELVIQTTALRARSPVGVRHRSEQATITERWRLIDHAKYGRALEIEMLIDDPVVYKAPARGRQLFVPAPADSVLSAYGCNEARWDDRVREKEEQIQAEAARAQR